MGSTLSERIANNQRSKSDKSRNKVAFLALKQDIASALSDGWSMKAIWETLFMEEKISFTYKTFCIYVSRFIATHSKSDTPKHFREDKKEKNKTTKEIRGFTFNPIPNLEELL